MAATVRVATDHSVDAQLGEVAASVAEFRNDPHYELEIRLGTFANGVFLPGVTRNVFFSLECDLVNSPTLDAEDGWKEIVDYHYVVHRGGRVRTRVEYDDQRMELNKEHIVKTTRRSTVLGCGDDGDDVCRVALSLEEPIANPPTVCVPTHVRIKQRRRFRDVRDGRTVWVYELSRTWSANGREAAEHRQKTMDPIFEIECELCDEGREYLRKHPKDTFIAQSLIMKAEMLLGRGCQPRSGARA